MEPFRIERRRRTRRRASAGPSSDRGDAKRRGGPDAKSASLRPGHAPAQVRAHLGGGDQSGTEDAAGYFDHLGSAPSRGGIGDIRRAGGEGKGGGEPSTQRFRNQLAFGYGSQGGLDSQGPGRGGLGRGLADG